MTKGATVVIVIYLNFQDLFTGASGHEQNKNAEALVKTLSVSVMILALVLRIPSDFSPKSYFKSEFLVYLRATISS